MTTVYVMTGLPASGKSTRARELDALRFNMDDIRAMLWGAASWNKDNEKVAVDAMINGARAAILAGRDVVMDNCHLTPGWPRRYRKEFGPLGVTFKVISYLDVPVNVCVMRDGERDNSVGNDVIHRLQISYEEARQKGWKLTDKWLNGESYEDPEPYEDTPGLLPVILCDLDGTVALNDGHRNHYDYTKVMDDKPNQPVVDLVRELQKDHKVIFVSGRKDSCYADTMSWLSMYKLLTPGQRLIMRDSDDNRPDYVIKAELFDKHIRGKFNVMFCLDDRDQVVRMYRNMGLTVLQVAYGDF